MTETAPTKPDSLTQLKKRRLHEGVTLPSGAVVTIKLPNLAHMVKSAQLPNDLIEVALRSKDEAPSLSAEAFSKRVQEDWEFTEFIVPITIHEPKIKAEDVSDLDPMDLDMVMAFATRRTDIDAVGHQLGGLETQASFRKHRGIVDLDEALAHVS